MGTRQSMVGSSGQDPGTKPNSCSRNYENKHRQNLGYHGYEMEIQVLYLALLTSLWYLIGPVAGFNKIGDTSMKE